jgi:hypothetical protein
MSSRASRGWPLGMTRKQAEELLASGTPMVKIRPGGTISKQPHYGIAILVAVKRTTALVQPTGHGHPVEVQLGRLAEWKSRNQQIRNQRALGKLRSDEHVRTPEKPSGGSTTRR